jgi:hypothetical protein
VIEDLYNVIAGFNDHILLLNFFIVFWLVVGSGFRDRIKGLPESHAGIFIVVCFAFGYLFLIIEAPLMHLSESRGMWPVMLFYSFALATINAVVIWISIFGVQGSTKRLSWDIKCALTIIAIKSIIYVFCFVSDLIFDNYVLHYLEIPISTLNILIIALKCVMAFKYRRQSHNKPKANPTKACLFESGANLYMDTLKENDIWRASNNHKLIKASFAAAIDMDNSRGLKGQGIQHNEKVVRFAKITKPD